MQIKVIDFGAACDLSTGINFNPEYGMLDPRYSGERCCIVFQVCWSVLVPLELEAGVHAGPALLW